MNSEFVAQVALSVPEPIDRRRCFGDAGRGQTLAYQGIQKGGFSDPHLSYDGDCEACIQRLDQPKPL
jgi:hypothetical protein